MIYIVRNRLIHQIFKQFYSYKHTQKNLKQFILIITKVCTSKLWLSYYFTTACKTKLYHWCIETLSITHTWYSTVKLLSLSLVRWLGSLNHFAPVAQRLVRSAAPGCSSAVCVDIVIGEEPGHGTRGPWWKQNIVINGTMWWLSLFDRKNIILQLGQKNYCGKQFSEKIEIVYQHVNWHNFYTSEVKIERKLKVKTFKTLCAQV